jgi:hypothetical protein
VRFTRRCVLNANVPKNSQGYQYAALRLGDDDEYDGEGIIEAGTPATIVNYASHGNQATDSPVVRVKGRIARTHQTNIEAA